MRPIIAWELKQRRSYVLWWTLVTAGLIAMLLLIYPSIRSQADQVNKILNQLPTTIRDLKTGGSQVNIGSPSGYLNSQLYYSTLPLLQIIMSIGLGSSLLAREEQNHTLELLLARPVSRGKVLLAKALSGIVLVVFVSIVTALVTVWLAGVITLQLPVTHLLLANLCCLLLSLSFGGVAFMLTAVSNFTPRISTAVAVAVSLGGYLLATLGNLSHYLLTPAKFLPYHYYSPTDILGGHVEHGFIAYVIGLLAVSALTSWFGFRRSDIS